MAMPRKVLHLPTLLSAILVIFFSYPAAGQDYYAGKTIRIIVGFSAGGGFDTYSRVIGRHLGTHIPGNPSVIVENMTGAGSLIAANHLYGRAKPDGLTVGNFHGGLLLQQIVGRKGIEFDARKFEWVGLPVSDTSACALTTASGVTNLDQWIAAKQPVKIGTEAPGASTSDIARVLRAALNLPMQLVEGYKGTADIRLAADSGEVAGGCWAWESIRTTWQKGLESGQVKVVVQVVAKKHPELKDVANAIDYAKTEQAKSLIDAGVQKPATVYRAYSLPPGTPKEQVKILRDAFAKTMKDPEFLAEAKKAKLDLDPMTGEEVEKVVAGLFKISPAQTAKLKEILAPK
jgi:tripartite-type tricarboxylate transporter receptor subunit TctC